MGLREEAARGGEETNHGTSRHFEGSQGQKRVEDSGQ